MCGIAGWVAWERDLSGERATLEAMAATIAHRGPDEAGIWLSPRAGLAHRRLIVVDPRGGGQPMVRTVAGRTCVISYNGELYNTDELRAELQARGQVFQSYSDTEVLLLSYMEWGASCLERLNGIFAFAVWDDRDETLFLARDRLGVKPLFYAAGPGSLLFASELKALLAHPAVEPVVDAEGLAEVLALGPARTPGHGVFRGVSELKPGHFLLYDRRGLRIRRYWSLESRPHEDDAAATAARVRELLQDAVQRQLVSDVPVCALLSGGLDSSAIAACAAPALARSGRGPLRTYSVDYVGNDRHFRPNAFEPDADAPWALRVAAILGTEHRTIVIDTPSLVEGLHHALRARDLPGMADIDASLYLLSREIKREATVGLSGECADEVFGGYPWLFQPEAVQADTFPWSRRLGERLRLLAPDVVSTLRPAEYVAERYREALAEVPRLPGEDPAGARMRELSYLNLTRWMPTLLDRKDRMSMAVGLEVRVPFCDHRLVEYAWNIPWAMKSCDGQPKGILRRALAGLLPPEVLARRKSPYPKTHDPSYLSAMRERVLEILGDRNSPLLPLIDEAAVRELARPGGGEMDSPWFGQLMRGPQLLAYLVQIDAWLRDYRISLRMSGPAAGGKPPRRRLRRAGTARPVPVTQPRGAGRPGL